MPAIHLRVDEALHKHRVLQRATRHKGSTFLFLIGHVPVQVRHRIENTSRGGEQATHEAVEIWQCWCCLVAGGSSVWDYIKHLF